MCTLTVFLYFFNHLVFYNRMKQYINKWINIVMWWSYWFEYHLQQWWLTAELCCSGKAQLLLRQLAEYRGKASETELFTGQSLLKEAQLFSLIKEDTCFFALSTFLWRTAPMPNPKAFLSSTTFHSHCSVFGLPWLQRKLNSRHIPF